jgi:glycosyltransferase involved in cell wall biosynthesis
VPTRDALSIVIPTRNRPEMLDRCLRHVLTGGRGGDEIIVVDSASADDGTARVAASHGARYVRLEVAGVSRARNAGWRAASHELVAFTDDDVRVHDGWRDAMASALADPDMAFVTGWIGVPADQADAPDPQPHIVEPHRHRMDREARRYYGAGGNFGVRHSALRDIGGFDERLGAGAWFGAAEDADLFDRLVAAGYVGEYRPDVRVDHDAWRSVREGLRQQWAYGKGIGARIRLLLHRDRDRAWRAARRALWPRGIKLVYRRLRERWWIGAGNSAMRLVGTVVGFVVALPRFRASWPVGDGVRNDLKQ